MGTPHSTLVFNAASMDMKLSNMVFPSIGAGSMGTYGGILYTPCVSNS